MDSGSGTISLIEFMCNYKLHKIIVAAGLNHDFPGPKRYHNDGGDGVLDVFPFISAIRKVVGGR